MELSKEVVETLEFVMHRSTEAKEPGEVGRNTFKTRDAVYLLLLFLDVWNPDISSNSDSNEYLAISTFGS